MPYRGLADFIIALERDSELQRIRTFVDPILEITEVTDRVTKNNGKALLFENNGTQFPVLINAFGSDTRIMKALGLKNLEEAGNEITDLFSKLTGMQPGIISKIRNIPGFIRMAGLFPGRSCRKGTCQQIVHMDPDLSILPVLKCWPYDGGRFITLPIVHTKHPDTGRTNAGMYRMQILDNRSTAMHWQLHKTGAAHFEAWKKTGKKMPVTVTLGGDPVYTYAATAPLPENIDEFILAGFLRKKRVKMVKCLTNDLFVPSDSDFVIEGYVDPSEDLVWEGPFGDHTGFYSLADWYPRFHVTCITHSKTAVYPATIVGVPPQEDAWLAKATERIFLAPLRLALQPEIEDFHMPVAGVAHNLVIVKISKTYPGQGKKVLSSLSGAGQMMFTKYMVVVSGDVDIRNYDELLHHIMNNLNYMEDLLFSSGPLDVLDHSSSTFANGGKLGIDATVKLKEEPAPYSLIHERSGEKSHLQEVEYVSELCSGVKSYNYLPDSQILIVGINQSEDPGAVAAFVNKINARSTPGLLSMILAVDNALNLQELFTVAWQVLGNCDPKRDILLIQENLLFFDGTAKVFRPGGFPRRWPDVVCSSDETIKQVDAKWDALEIRPFLPSPSLSFSGLAHGKTAQVTPDRES